jgi:beta-glucosidase
MLWLLAGFAAAAYPFPFLDPSLPIERRVDLLVDNLTLAEKVGQMMNTAPAIPRLGIPAYEWWNEALHGIARAGNATVFPQTIGLGATFDSENILKTYEFISDEARAKHERYISLNQRARYQGLTFWTPNINIFRDPRWGRGQETFGEDPYLTSVMAKQVVKGLQGNLSSGYYKAHGCAKHFAVHSGPESTRHTFDVHPKDRDLNQTYLVGFKELVNSGVAEVMCAYNRIRGQPACASTFLFGKLKEWNFKGIVTSDCYAIDDFWMKGHHETHANASHASADAVLKGTTIECGSQFRSLVNATKEGLISEAAITGAVKKLFTERFKLGMFDPRENVPFSKIPYSVVQSTEHRVHALKMARESIVLLQNDGTLPLRGPKRVLVLGPNADNVDMLWGNYHGFNIQGTQTILEGLRSKPNLTVDFTEGCDHTNVETVWIDLWQNVTSLVNGQTVAGFTGYFYPNPNLLGAPTVTKVLPRLRWHDGGESSLAGGNFPTVNYSVRFIANFTATFTGALEIKATWRYGCRLVFGSMYHFDDWTNDTHYPPDEDGHTRSEDQKVLVETGVTYPITIEYFHGDDEAILNVALTRPLQNDRATIAEKAARADVIVFVGGITPSLEGEEMPVTIEGFSGGDRTQIELPRVQRDLLANLKTLKLPVVFVLCAGSAVAFNKTGLNAVVDAFYPGEAGGQAIADVLVGDYNPGGRLPVTFYTATSELADISDYDMSSGRGRTYRYYKGTPLYPFGHGLSYTMFAYSDLKISGNPLADASVHISFGVRNAGNLPGDEVIQVYVSSGRAGEPLKSLKYFKRQRFEPAAQATKIEIDLPASAFATFSEGAGTSEVAEGKFTVSAGGSSSGAGVQSVEVTFNKKGKSSTALIVGVTVGVVVVLIAIVGVVCVCRKRRRAAPLLESGGAPPLLA